MKWLNLILALLFVLFAYYQWNDPDPYGWIAIYLSVAVVCGMAAMGKYYLPLIRFALIISLLWCAILVPEFINWIFTGAESIVQEMKAEKPAIEYTREFLGLLIISATLYFQFRKGQKLKTNKLGKL